MLQGTLRELQRPDSMAREYRAGQMGKPSAVAPEDRKAILGLQSPARRTRIQVGLRVRLQCIPFAAQNVHILTLTLDAPQNVSLNAALTTS